MKRAIALTVFAALSQAIAAFAGPEAKQVIAPARINMEPSGKG
jgi:hypothetical protein